MSMSKKQKFDKKQCLLFATGSFVICSVFMISVWIMLNNEEDSERARHYHSTPCVPTKCLMNLAETIPENLTFAKGQPRNPSVYSVWKELIQRAETSIDIASSYWSLRGNDTDIDDPSTLLGEDIYAELLKAGTERGIKIRIAQTLPSSKMPSQDTIDLAAAGAAEVRSLDFPRWFNAGILHTKMWLVDGKHFYLGSANLDWRSLSQVKEMAISAYDCDCMAKDMAKIFEVYWLMGGSTAKTAPPQWPPALCTDGNIATPMSFAVNSIPTQAYLASSPPELCPKGRSSDIDAILSVMKNSRKFIYIAVMDYFPMTLYTWPRKFWPVLDDALRQAALDSNIEIRLMASWWKHSRPELKNHLKSLMDLNGVNKAKISVKLFKVPSYTKAQEEIPFARVNHNKYMVTDKQAYIGTSNWAADYFISTGGIGLVMEQENTTNSRGINTIRADLQAVFLRDWQSEYASSVDLA